MMHGQKNMKLLKIVSSDRSCSERYPEGSVHIYLVSM